MKIYGDYWEIDSGSVMGAALDTFGRFVAGKSWSKLLVRGSVIDLSDDDIETLGALYRSRNRSEMNAAVDAIATREAIRRGRVDGR